MNAPTAILISHKYSRNNGKPNFNFIVQMLDAEEVMHISPSDIYNDQTWMAKFSAEDRERIAYWTGVEQISVRNLQTEILKKSVAHKK